jgi:hypothetical protein
MMKSSLKVLVLVSVLVGSVLITAGAGCATSHVKYPAGTVVIDNRTPYTLDIMSNGHPWMVETTNLDREGKFLILPEEMGHGQSPLVLSNVTESVTVEIRAIEFQHYGCLQRRISKGECSYGIPTGTRGAKIIVVKTKDLQR